MSLSPSHSGNKAGAPLSIIMQELVAQGQACGGAHREQTPLKTTSANGGPIAKPPLQMGEPIDFPGGLTASTWPGRTPILKQPCLSTAAPLPLARLLGEK